MINSSSLFIKSGIGFCEIERVKDIQANHSLDRIITNDVSSFAPKNQSRLFEYPTTSLNFSFLPCNTGILSLAGLCHTSGVLFGLKNSQEIDFNWRTYSNLEANFSKDMFFESGVLNSFSINFTHSEISCSLSYEFLKFNSTGISSGINYNQFDSLPLLLQLSNTTGILNSGIFNFNTLITSMNLDISIQRVKNILIGEKYPKDRKILSANANITVDCIFDSFNASNTDNEKIFSDNITTGTFSIEFRNSQLISPLKLEIINPRITDFSFNHSNSLISVRFSMVAPLTFIASELKSYSNIRFFS